MSKTHNTALQPPRTQLVHDLFHLPERYGAEVIFMVLVGSQVFGIATLDSDFDIKGAHLEEIDTVLGMQGYRETRESLTTHPMNKKKVECQTHELEHFVAMLMSGNSNALEALYSPLLIKSSTLHETLKDLGRSCITKATGKSYESMANRLSRRMKHNETKKFLHVYRCYLMGIHLMKTGDLVYSLPDLAHEYTVPQVFDLIEMKKEGVMHVAEKECLSLRAHTLDMSVNLSLATDTSRLPEKPSEEALTLLERLVIRTRKECVIYDYNRQPYHQTSG